MRVDLTRDNSRTQRPNASGRMIGYRVLLVDDDSECRDMLAAFLTLEGHTVCSAADGAAAMAVALEFHPDVILTDICMPRVSGVELCRRLRGDPRTRSVPVLGMTALSQHTWDDFIGSDFDIVLRKPLDLDGLTHRLIEACNGKVHPPS
jgi:CheY-like chemotaxis protein